MGKNGGKNMGKKIKIFLAIGFFPIVIFCYIIKLIYKSIERSMGKKYLSQISISKIDSLDGEDFEDFLYYLLRDKGFKVERTKRSHDYGADLIVSSKHETIAIQCKLYYRKSVSNSAIQEASSAREYYGTTKAVVITNSYFTKPAEILATKIGVKLINREGLINLINNKSLSKETIFT